LWWRQETANFRSPLIGHRPKDDPELVARQGFEALMAGRKKPASSPARPTAQRLVRPGDRGGEQRQGKDRVLCVAEAGPGGLEQPYAGLCRGEFGIGRLGFPSRRCRTVKRLAQH
jgi:hypothetical protein